MEQKIVLLNGRDEIIRTFGVSEHTDKVFVVYRRDLKRLVVTSDVISLKRKGIEFGILHETTVKELKGSELKIQGFGRIRLQSDSSFSTVEDIGTTESQNNGRRVAIVSTILYLLLGFSLMQTFEVLEVEEKKEERKQEIVKIVKRKLQVQQRKKTVAVRSNMVASKPATVKKSLKRRGALGILGQLKKSMNKGGLNVQAANTTRGVGLGGKQGSGGVQKSLYGKGIVKAALGPGANIQGGGGYGTKGKGGGQAGYGTISMVGSAGSAPIPVPTEATEIDGGLSMDMVADVVRRNIGQVRYCYEQGLQGNSALRGRVAISWVIDGNGQVETARVKNTSLNDGGVESCIVSKLKTWKFPVPDGNVKVKVSYPFMLKKLGRG